MDSEEEYAVIDPDLRPDATRLAVGDGWSRASFDLAMDQVQQRGESDKKYGESIHSTFSSPSPNTSTAGDNDEDHSLAINATVSDGSQSYSAHLLESPISNGDDIYPEHLLEDPLGNDNYAYLQPTHLPGPMYFQTTGDSDTYPARLLENPIGDGNYVYPQSFYPAGPTYSQPNIDSACYTVSPEPSQPSDATYETPNQYSAGYPAIFHSSDQAPGTRYILPKPDSIGYAVIPQPSYPPVVYSTQHKSGWAGYYEARQSSQSSDAMFARSGPDWAGYAGHPQYPLRAAAMPALSTPVWTGYAGYSRSAMHSTGRASPGSSNDEFRLARIQVTREEMLALRPDEAAKINLRFDKPNASIRVQKDQFREYNITPAERKAISFMREGAGLKPIRKKRGPDRSTL